MFLACTCAILIYFISFYFSTKQKLIYCEKTGVHGIWKLSTSSFYFIVFIVIVVLVSTVRYGFIDTYAYKIMYTSSRNNLNYVNSAPWGVEVGWLYLCYLLNYISRSPKLILFLSALIINLSYCKMTKKYSIDSIFSLIVYFSILFMDTNNGIRQLVAAGITTLAFPLLTRKDIKSFILYLMFVYLAMQFHESAIVCLIISVVVKGNALNIKVVLTLILGIIFLVRADLVNMYIGDLFQDSKYLFYLEFDDYGMSFLRAFIMGILPALLAILYIVKQRFLLKSKIDSTEAILLNVLLINSVFVLMGLDMQYWARFSFYTSFAYIVLAPKLILDPFKKSNFRIVKILAISCYVVFFVYNIYVNSVYGSLNQFYIDL